jgi:phosphonate transport system permease protein
MAKEIQPSSLPERPFLERIHFNGWLIAFGVLALIVISAQLTGVNLSELLNRRSLEQFSVIWIKMMSPDWGYLPTVFDPIMETLQMALIGTLAGSALAVPFSVLAARNLIKNAFFRGVVRMFANLVRTLPDLMLAALFVAVVGIGPLAGVLTLTVFTFGMMTKLLYESIETIDEGPIEALTAAGANKIQVIIFAVVPQVLNNFLSFFLYSLEINVRSSTILGYLGAGGVGFLLQTTMGEFAYNRTAVVIVAIFVVVVIVDGISNQLRERLA